LEKYSNLVSFLSQALCQQDKLQAQGWILGKDNEAVASGPFFQRYCARSWELCTIVWRLCTTL